MQTYAIQLLSLIRAIQKFDSRIAQVFAQHADHDLFESFPAPATSALHASRPRSVRTVPVGILLLRCSPTLESLLLPNVVGKALWIHHRLACPNFIKQTFHEFADQSIRFSKWARAYYDQMRARGKDRPECP